MNNIKDLSEGYFEENASRYTEEYYLQQKTHPKWVRQKYILKLVEEFSHSNKDKILDVGCGPGFLSIDLAKSGHTVVGVDTSEKMISISKKQAFNSGVTGCDFYIGDAEKTNFKDASFDCVVASGVIEYMNKDDIMLKEMNRILKPNGHLILNVSNVMGYSNALNFFTDNLKKIPGIMNVASKLRKNIMQSKYGADQLHFSPRKHFIPKFRKTLLRHGFIPKAANYLSFTFLPAPFSTITYRFLHKVESKLDFLNKTPFRVFGATYVVCAQKIDE